MGYKWYDFHLWPKKVQQRTFGTQLELASQMARSSGWILLCFYCNLISYGCTYNPGRNFTTCVDCSILTATALPIGHPHHNMTEPPFSFTQQVDKMSLLVSVTGGVVSIPAPTRSQNLQWTICQVSHFLFNRYEPRRATAILSLVLAPPLIIAFWLYPSNRSPITALARSYAIHLASLVVSVVAYRLSPYHPLAAIPGPLLCKVTRLWALYIVQTGNQHRYYKSLHDRYGTHVRTGEGIRPERAFESSYLIQHTNTSTSGPNHIHISDASGLATVMGIKPFLRGERLLHHFQILNIDHHLNSLFRIHSRSASRGKEQSYRNSRSTRTCPAPQNMGQEHEHKGYLRLSRYAFCAH